MKASVCMSAYNKPAHLRKSLQSIFRQDVPFEFEVIVVDDGSKDSIISSVCSEFDRVRCIRIDRDPVFRNPCTGRNVAYKASRGDFLILQSDDVVHITEDSVNKLVTEVTMHPNSFLIAHVLGCGPDGVPWSEYTGLSRQVPYFFLGIVRRSHLYAVGGNDEEFSEVIGYEDQWFADCLINGLSLTTFYSESVVGHHQYHPRSDTDTQATAAKAFYERKYADAAKSNIWVSSGGAWCEATCDFDVIFEQNVWLGEESRSGTGSSLEATEVVRKEIPQVISSLGAHKFLDVPCGDCNWISHLDWRDVDYLGVDISQKAVDHNRVKYPHLRFTCLDLRIDTLPTSDLVFCRDCLGHLSLADCWSAIHNIRRSGSTYLLTTTFQKKHNRDKVTGSDWTPRSLCEPPFNFPEPLRLISENHDQPGFTDKSLGLWRISDL